MKKTIFSLIAGLTLILGAASCSESGDEPIPAPVVNPDGTQTFEINALTAEDFRARSTPAAGEYGDGSLATVLDWAIYEGESKVPFKKSTDTGAPQATVTANGFKLSVNLDPSKTYKIFLFAHSSTQGRAPYTVDYSSTEHYYDITMNHHNDGAPDRNDAFAGLFDLSKDKRSFTLYRPLTQIMICTDEDLSAFDLTKLRTEIKLVNTSSGNQPLALTGYNDVDKGVFGSTSIGSYYTTQLASIHNGKTMNYNSRKLKTLALDYMFNVATLPAGTAVQITFKNGTETLGTKIFQPSRLDYATRYILIPKPGQSLVGNSDEITITKFTGFPATDKFTELD